MCFTFFTFFFAEECQAKNVSAKGKKKIILNYGRGPSPPCPMVPVVSYDHIMHDVIHNTSVNFENDFVCKILNKSEPLSLGNGVKYYYMVASDVSDVPNGRNQFLGVDVTGPWRFLCSKDRFDWGMASHACASLWVLEFYFPTVYWSTYPQ